MSTRHPNESALVGKTIGHYRITAAIGAGGMGEVYKASDTRLGREIAVKVLPDSVASDPDRLGRFEREAKAVAALSHPNIVTLHSIEEAGGIRFLTMELVDGQTLDRLIDPGGLPVARILDLVIPLADALAAAHARGVVHRDLKPSNVMVTRDGRVKVLDFGLAKLASAEPEAGMPRTMTMDAPISAVGQVVGTVPYMAPEQVRGDPVDERTDIFALGIVLFEMATGRRPFGGSTPADVSSAILRDAPAPARELRGELPPDLDRIIARCLEKDPERRVQTAKDVRNELEHVRRSIASGSSSSARAPKETAPADDREIPSVAVLPFVNRSRDEDDEYFSDGLADELLSVLAKIRGLRVAARTSSSKFKGKEVTIAEVGRALNVATVLEGSLRKSGNRVRISVQLVKVSDGYPMWSETYDRTLDDIFAVQDDIAQSVVKELRTTLLGETPDSNASGEAKADVAAAVVGRAESAEAHRLYLQGKYFVERLSHEDAVRGIEYLRRALDLDPAHALAWVALAVAYSNEAGWGSMPVVDGYRRAREAVERAIALAPSLAEAHVELSAIQRMHDWDWAVAEAACRRALELAPGSADALREAGVLAHHMCRYEVAADLIERAVQQDPLSSRAHSYLAQVYRSMGRRSEAIAELSKALELAPQRIAAHHLLSVLHADEGRDAEALAEAAKEPAEWGRLTSLAYTHHLAGRHAQSDEALRELEAKFAADAALQIAAVRSIRGEADEAFAWLERAYAQRDAGLSILLCEPTLRPLHGDPRWRALSSKMGLRV